MRKRTALMGGGSVTLGLVFLYSAFVWWTINGIAAIDTLDGESPGPLHGYGVTAVLVLGGFSLLLVGIRRCVQALSGS